MYKSVEIDNCIDCLHVQYILLCNDTSSEVLTRPRVTAADPAGSNPRTSLSHLHTEAAQRIVRAKRRGRIVEKKMMRLFQHDV